MTEEARNRQVEIHNHAVPWVERALTRRGGFGTWAVGCGIPCGRFLAAAILLAAVTCPALVLAAGDEFTMRAEDLIVTVDSRWAGGSQGGYWPIRIRVVNRGPARVLTFRFDTRETEQLPDVSRTIGVEQNATVRFTLSVPLVSQGQSGYLRVYDQGRRIEPLSNRHLGLASADPAGFDRPSLLVISEGAVDCRHFEAVVNSLSAATTGVGGAWVRRWYGAARSDDHQIVSPEMLPDAWIDYSGLDLVCAALEVLEGLPRETRQALLQWVQQGGTLIVTEVGVAADKSPRLARLLELGRHAYVGSAWEGAAVGARDSIMLLKLDEYGNVVAQVDEDNPGSSKPVDLERQFTWQADPGVFMTRPLMQGLVCGFSGNPFPGTAHDWAWLLNTLTPVRYQWTSRHGLSARREHNEFLQFLIPGLRGIPVGAFVGLITVFTVVIGPLNYIWMAKRKQLYLLVVTIPAIALLTSGALFGYSAVAHGFSVKSRVRSLTILDQKSRTAIATSRISLYAGLAPSKGLQFSARTAVYPIWPEHGGFESGRVNWTERQALEAGFLRSRTRTQFLTVTHREERGRLEVKGAAPAPLSVVNGLEWDIQALVLADPQGRLHYGGELPAGAAMRLAEASPEDLALVADLVRRHPLEMPAGVRGGSGSDLFGFRDMRHYYWGNAVSLSYAGSLVERRIAELSQPQQLRSGALPARTYLAVLKHNPGIETGVSAAEERASLHLLVGYYE